MLYIYFCLFRGLCEETLFDTIYKPVMSMNDIIYVGITGTFIKYSKVEQAWIVFKLLNENELAEIKTRNLNYLFGVNTMEILREDSCEIGIRQVSFSTCSEKEFTCTDGFCVSLLQRCNHKSDCRDGSDEINCNILRLKADYNKHLAPIQNFLILTDNSNDNRLVINVSATVIDILDINEMDSAIKVKIRTFLSWFDSDLNFLNLHRETSLNLLTEEESQFIWRPELYFQDINIFDREQNEAENVLVKNEDYNYTTTDLEIVSNERLYSGKTNILVQSRTDR